MTILFTTKSIQAVLFDLDGTLRHNQPNAIDALFDFAVQLGLEDMPEMRLEATRWAHYYWAQSSQMIEDKKLFPDDDLFWKNYCYRTLIAYGCMPGQARELVPKLFCYMRDEYKPSNWVPPEVPTTLEKLQEAGIRIATLSNRSQSYGEELESLGLASYFEFTIAAGEVDAWKPDPAIFHYAITQLSTKPEETLYIGDNYFADVIGAQKARLQPILIDPMGIFPDAECTVIHNVSEICDLICQ